MHPTSKLARRAACALAVWFAVSVPGFVFAEASPPLVPMRSSLEETPLRAIAASAAADTAAHAEAGADSLRAGVPAAPAKPSLRYTPFFVFAGVAAAIFVVRGMSGEPEHPIGW